MKSLAFTCIALTGFAFQATPEAEAGGGIAISIGGRGYNVGYRSGFVGRGNGYGGYAPRHGYGYAPQTFHGVNHWGYAPGFQQQRGVHYVPQSYQLHQQRYWHHYGPSPFGYGR